MPRAVSGKKICPKRGLIRPKRQLFVLVFLYNYCVWGFSIIPELLILTPGQIAIFSGTFWNDQKINQHWTLGPRIYHQDTSNSTRKYENILEQIISENLRL